MNNINALRLKIDALSQETQPYSVTPQRVSDIFDDMLSVLAKNPVSVYIVQLDSEAQYNSIADKDINTFYIW